MSNEVLSLDNFRGAARAALYEVELNALKGKDNEEMQDKLWQYFDLLERIVKSSQPVEDQEDAE